MNFTSTRCRLPQTAAAWRGQQARWTKGHAQVARKLLSVIWGSAMPLWKKTAMTLQMCQFSFYMLAFGSAAVSLTLMSMGVVYYPGVQWLGLLVTVLGIFSSIGYLYLGQRMLNRQHEDKLVPSLLLAVVFPSGLILANTRATIDAFFSSRMDFNRTTRVGIRPARYQGMRPTAPGRPSKLSSTTLPSVAEPIARPPGTELTRTDGDPAFDAAVASTRRSAPTRPFISNLTGRPMTADDATSTRYWVNHLREAVRFADGLAAATTTPGADRKSVV